MQEQPPTDKHNKRESRRPSHFFYHARVLTKLLLLLPLGAALAWLAATASGLVPAARFTRERIDITVRPSAVEVCGLYVYENPWPFPVTQGLAYPFPVDDSHPAPVSIQVTEADPADGSDLRVVPTFRLGGTPRYSIRIRPGGVAHVRVRYVQPAYVPSATYLLTTTQPWGRPLEHGEYVLNPMGVRILESSYPLDGPEPHSFVRRDFMPDKDWRFSWRKN